MGKLLGAHYLVLGGYFDVMGALRADARVVEVEETGRVVQSVGATGKPDDFLSVEQSLATSLTGILGTKLAAAAPPPARPAAPKKPRPRPPAKLMMRTAILYSTALGHVDAGEKEKAKETLAAVVKEQPDFQLAAVDLDKLMQ